MLTRLDSHFILRYDFVTQTLTGHDTKPTDSMCLYPATNISFPFQMMCYFLPFLFMLS